jgi:hypothetical protein
MRIIGNLCEITGIIIWLTKKLSRMLDNSYGISGLIFGNQNGLAGFLG